jgi:hypothetical protein
VDHGVCWLCPFARHVDNRVACESSLNRACKVAVVECDLVLPTRAAASGLRQSRLSIGPFSAARLVLYIYMRLSMVDRECIKLRSS